MILTLFQESTIENQNNIMMIEKSRTTSRDIKDIIGSVYQKKKMNYEEKNGEWETLDV